MQQAPPQNNNMQGNDGNMNMGAFGFMNGKDNVNFFLKND